MTRRIMIVGLLSLLCAVFSARTLAQACDTASLSNDLANFSTQMKSASSASSVLTEISAWLDEQAVACEEAQPTQVPAEPGAPEEPTMSFSSQQDGNQPVLGPLKIADGVYRVRLETAGFFIAELEALEGQCELLTTFGFFNISAGQAENGAEVVLIAKDCEALITTSNVSKAWTLDLYLYGPEDITTLKTEYSSSIDGTMPVLGPIQFENGRYKVTLKTDGFFIAGLETVGGSCEISGFLGLYNISAGQASQGAQTVITTNDCIALVTTSNVSKPWTLTFEPLQ